MKLRDLDPVLTGTQFFYFVPYCSEKWNAEGLRSDGNASNRTVPFQKMEQPKKLFEKWNGMQSFRSSLNRQMENMPKERLRSRLYTKQNWYAIVSFLCEQHFVRSRNWNENGTDR